MLTTTSTDCVPVTDSLSFLHASLPNGTDLQLIEEVVLGDGNCAFTALGTTRVAVVELFLAHANDPEVRKIFATEIKGALLTNEFQDPNGQRLLDEETSLTNKLHVLLTETKKWFFEVDSVADQYSIEEFIHYLTQLAKTDPLKEFCCTQLISTLNQVNSNITSNAEQIDQYLTDSTTYTAYIELYRNQLYLSYDGILLYARLQSLNVYIFTRDTTDNNLLTLRQYYFTEDSSNTIYMLHTGNAEQPYNHFNLLVESTFNPQQDTTNLIDASAVLNAADTPSIPALASSTTNTILNQLSLSPLPLTLTTKKNISQRITNIITSKSIADFWISLAGMLSIFITAPVLLDLMPIRILFLLVVWSQSAAIYRSGAVEHRKNQTHFSELDNKHSELLKFIEKLEIANSQPLSTCRGENREHIKNSSTAVNLNSNSMVASGTLAAITTSLNIAAEVTESNSLLSTTGYFASNIPAVIGLLIYIFSYLYTNKKFKTLRQFFKKETEQLLTFALKQVPKNDLSEFLKQTEQLAPSLQHQLFNALLLEAKELLILLTSLNHTENVQQMLQSLIHIFAALENLTSTSPANGIPATTPFHVDDPTITPNRFDLEKGPQTSPSNSGR